MNLGSPDYLTSARREQILDRRDYYRTLPDDETTASPWCPER
jgi:hypothetical protein